MPTDPSSQAKVRLGPLALSPAIALTNAGVDDNVFNDPSDASPKSDFTMTVEPQDRPLAAHRTLDADGQHHGRPGVLPEIHQSALREQHDHRRAARPADAHHLQRSTSVISTRRIVPASKSTRACSAPRSRPTAASNCALLSKTFFGVKAHADGGQLRSKRRRFDGVQSGERAESHEHGRGRDGAPPTDAADESRPSTSTSCRIGSNSITSAIPIPRTVERRREVRSVRTAEGERARRLPRFQAAGRRACPAYQGSTACRRPVVRRGRIDKADGDGGARHQLFVRRQSAVLRADRRPSSRSPSRSSDRWTSSAASASSSSITAIARAPSVAVPSRTDYVHSYGGGIGYHVGTDVRIGFNIDQTHRTSDIAERQYDDLRYGAAVTYGF